MLVEVSKGIKFNLELQKNILKFGYSINYKYEGMLAHSFDRFYIITQIYVAFNRRYKVFQVELYSFLCIYEQRVCPNSDSRKYLTELKTYCNKIRPFLCHCTNLIKSYNTTVYNILENEISPYYLNYLDKNMA